MFSGFPSCDGVGGTLKRLAAHASLQRLFSANSDTVKSSQISDFV